MYYLNEEYAWSMDITSELDSFYWGSFTAKIWTYTSSYVFLTLVEDAVEALLFLFETLLEDILAVSVALSSLLLKNVSY